MTVTKIPPLELYKHGESPRSLFLQLARTFVEHGSAHVRLMGEYDYPNVVFTKHLYDTATMWVSVHLRGCAMAGIGNSGAGERVSPYLHLAIEDGRLPVWPDKDIVALRALISGVSVAIPAVRDALAKQAGANEEPPPFVFEGEDDGLPRLTIPEGV